MSSTVSRRFRLLTWRRAVVFVLILLGGGGAYAGYRYWLRHEFEAECQFARRQEDWRAERDAARRWAKVDPQNGRPWWLAAEAAQELEDLPDLADCLAHVPDDDPNVLLAWIEKANLEWTVLNQPLDALKTTQKALAVDSRLVELHSRLISFYAMNLQRAPMIKAIRHAIENDAEPREAYVYLLMADLLSFSNGSALNSRWLSAAPDENRFKIGLAINTAMSFAQNADSQTSDLAVAMNKEARQQLQWFLENTPHDVVLLGYLMNLSYQAGDVDRCRELLTQVDDSGADDHMVWVYRAWYSHSVGDLAGAEESITEALKLHPMSATARHEYATILRKQKRSDEEVKRQQTAAAEGTELRALVLHEQSVTSMPIALYERLAQYAHLCGDTLIERALQSRIESPPMPLNTP